MALPASTLATYQAIGNREDLSDKIYRIDPTDTPFMSGIEREKATATLHEWQTQALAAADGTNAVLEGDDATTDTVTVTVRLSNICQISDKVARVTGTQQAVDHAGRGSEIEYQEMLKGLELKRDIETVLLRNQTKVTGDTTTARTTSAVLSWIKTNTSKTGTDPTTSGTVTRVDGTQRAFTEAQVKTVLAAIYEAGGKPDTIMAGSFNKQQFSTFTGRSSPTEDAKSREIVASVDAYRSDFGRLKLVTNRFQRTRDVLILQMDMWALAYLRPIGSKNLAVTGDSTRRQILGEYALVSRNEKASGIVADLTTS
jgi:hypothetical protein